MTRHAAGRGVLLAAGGAVWVRAVNAGGSLESPVNRGAARVAEHANSREIISSCTFCANRCANAHLRRNGTRAASLSDPTLISMSPILRCEWNRTPEGRHHDAFCADGVRYAGQP